MSNGTLMEFQEFYTHFAWFFTRNPTSCLGKGIKNLTQSFSDLSQLGQDSLECYSGFIVSKLSLNPQVSITKDQSWFYDIYL